MFVIKAVLAIFVKAAFGLDAKLNFLF